jgi:hypothetical protein
MAGGGGVFHSLLSDTTNGIVQLDLGVGISSDEVKRRIL